MGFKNKLHRTLPDLGGSHGDHGQLLGSLFQLSTVTTEPLTTLLMITDRLYYTPVYIPRRSPDIFTLAEFELTVAAGAGGVIRAGIYRSDRLTGRPTGAPLAETGTFPTTGVASIYDITLPDIALPSEGVYWIASVAQVGVPAPTVRAIRGFIPWSGAGLFLGNVNVADCVGWYKAGINGALPTSHAALLRIPDAAPRFLIQ